MIVLMSIDAAGEQIEAVLDAIEAQGLRPIRMPGDDNLAIGITSQIPPDVRYPLADTLLSLRGVHNVVHVSRPYKLVSREFRSVQTVVKVRDVEIGGPACVVMGGGPGPEGGGEKFWGGRALKGTAGGEKPGGAPSPPASAPSLPQPG